MRVTPAEVLVIMDNVTLDEAIVNSYIIGANAMVTDIFGTSSLVETTLKEIERWVSAHLIAVTRERMAKKEGAGGAFIEYAGSFGEGLQSTTFGQTAIALDYTGTLAALSLKKRQAWLRAIEH